MLARKFASMLELTNGETEVLGEISRHRRKFTKGESIICAGDRYGAAWVIQKGWCSRSRTLSDGRRQIFEFNIPGDVICLQGYFAERSDEDVIAMGSVEVSALGYTTLTTLLEAFPRIGALIFWKNKEWMLDKWKLTSQGRGGTRERLISFLLEHWYRLNRIDPETENRFELPLSQQEIADALGISVVHVNRVLRHLREEGLVFVEWHPASGSTSVELRELGHLLQLAEFVEPPQLFTHQFAPD